MGGRWGAVEDIDDRQCLLRMTSDSLDWPAMALGAVGADFEVLSPPELLDHVRDWGHRFSRATASTGPEPVSKRGPCPGSCRVPGVSSGLRERDSGGRLE
ncbi:MAG: WYL domain-containing protein [Actinomycetota bacterium]|nr:WYL domain-containing protein [Actinomycetota bacterium]